MLEAAGFPVHDLYCALLRFEDDVLATAELGWHVPAGAAEAPTTGLTVVGTEGWLRIEQADTGLRYWSNRDAPSVHPVIDVTFWPQVHGVPAGALTSEIMHFLECVRSGARPAITLDDAVEALRLSLAMEASAERDEVIALSEFGVPGPERASS